MWWWLCVASRYRNEEVARMIMRLEQSSKSYMNRNITSHEAFAMLYGSSKHYINKPEVIEKFFWRCLTKVTNHLFKIINVFIIIQVLLGRATGEYLVDIDLAKSGSWKKISRRQVMTLFHNINMYWFVFIRFWSMERFKVWVLFDF